VNKWEVFKPKTLISGFAGKRKQLNENSFPQPSAFQICWNTILVAIGMMGVVVQQI